MRRCKSSDTSLHSVGSRFGYTPADASLKERGATAQLFHRCTVAVQLSSCSRSQPQRSTTRARSLMLLLLSRAPRAILPLRLTGRLQGQQQRPEAHVRRDRAERRKEAERQPVPVRGVWDLPAEALRVSDRVQAVQSVPQRDEARHRCHRCRRRCCTERGAACARQISQSRSRRG